MDASCSPLAPRPPTLQPQADDSLAAGKTGGADVPAVDGDVDGPVVEVTTGGSVDAGGAELVVEFAGVVTVVATVDGAGATVEVVVVGWLVVEGEVLLESTEVWALSPSD